MWDLPRPGLEPVSPALAGRFSTTAPPGKPLSISFPVSVSFFFILSTLLVLLLAYAYISASFFPQLYSLSARPVTPLLSLLLSLPPHSRAPQVAVLASCSLSSSALLATSCPLFLSQDQDALKATVPPFILSQTFCAVPHHCCPPYYHWSRAAVPMLLSNPWRSGFFIYFSILFTCYFQGLLSLFHFTVSL